MSIGKHYLIDYTNIFGDEHIIGQFVFDLMIDSIVQNTKMKIVHRKLKILSEEDNTPPGFTSVLLLDESHFTAHCYSKKGLLALDIFTCGETDTFKVVNYFHKKLIDKYPFAENTFLKNVERFNK